MYLYLTARSEPERRLIEAECAAVTGATPDERGIALTEMEADVSRAAYVKMCMRVLTHASNLPELYARLEQMGLSSDQFRVSVTRLPRRLPLDSHQVMHEVGARIAGNPNLSEPRTTFLLVATAGEVWLGEMLSESDGSWNEHSQKAHPYSSALPTRLARAMVNLAAAPGDRIIDPCCGSGTILIEAASIGIRVVGCDINPRMAAASVGNLRHFGLSSLVLIADARNLAGNFDAVVTDLPYGRNCAADDQSCRGILRNLRNLAPRAAIVTGENVSEWLLQMGYEVEQVIPVPKSALIRCIHILRALWPAAVNLE